MILTGENQGSRKKKSVQVPLCPQKNFGWTELGSNPDLSGDSPATNRLSHGTPKMTVQRKRNISHLEKR